MAINGDGRANAIAGTALDDTIDGRDGDDSLDGGDGDDSLIGGLGDDRFDFDPLKRAGADTMVGGAGNDEYTVDATDVVVELAGHGDDAIWSLVSYSLAGLVNVENLYLYGSASVSATGNSRDNALLSNPGNNSLYGEDGNDWALFYFAAGPVAANLGNQLAAGDGSDAFVSIENVAGGDYDDTLWGSNGDNAFEGRGGNDSIMGRGGFDWAYYTRAEAGVRVSLALDGPQNTFGAGVDSLIEIEGLKGSVHADSLTGDSGANFLHGNRGADTLKGGAGVDRLVGAAGKDVLTGGAGHDFFRLDAAAGPANADVFKDFAHGADLIELKNEVFKKLPADGVPLGARFFKGPDVDVLGATASGQRILYDTTSGRLYYDPDGNGPADKLALATVYDTGSHPAPLSAADFRVI